MKTTSELLKPIPGLSPPGGFYFLERSGVRLEAPTWAGLLDAIASFRAVNGYPAGDIEAEAAHAICVRHPEFCRSGPREPAGGPGAALASAVLEDSERVASRLASARAARVFADSDTVAGRAAVCRKCVFRTPLPEAATLVDQRVSQIRTLLTRSVEHTDLGYCSAFHHDCALRCMLPETALPAGRQIVAGCWLT